MRGGQGGQQRKSAREKLPLAPVASSAAPTDGWTTLAFTPARVVVATAPGGCVVSDLGSGPERRSHRSDCRSSRNPRYSVGRRPASVIRRACGRQPRLPFLARGTQDTARRRCEWPPATEASRS
jgi:hypothetical protein